MPEAHHVRQARTWWGLKLQGGWTGFTASKLEAKHATFGI